MPLWKLRSPLALLCQRQLYLSKDSLKSEINCWITINLQTQPSLSSSLWPTSHFHALSNDLRCCQNPLVSQSTGFMIAFAFSAENHHKKPMNLKLEYLKEACEEVNTVKVRKAHRWSENRRREQEMKTDHALVMYKCIRTCRRIYLYSQLYVCVALYCCTRTQKVATKLKEPNQWHWVSYCSFKDVLFFCRTPIFPLYLGCNNSCFWLLVITILILTYSTSDLFLQQTCSIALRPQIILMGEHLYIHSDCKSLWKHFSLWALYLFLIFQ